jgi:putative nucleotidyltransferase with HDIG domain
MPASLSIAPARKPRWKPEQVPPFPSVALKALKLMGGTDTSLLQLCNMIQADAAFSVEILRIANSPLVAFSKEITSVMQASILLGFRRLRSVVITVGLRAYLAEPVTPLLRSCWRHSLACAIIAERAAKASSMDKDFAYTAGIMHDIGRVVLAISDPSYARLGEYRPGETGVGTPGNFLSIEHDSCGMDHCEAGGALVKEWALPSALSTITAHHHHQPILHASGPKAVRAGGVDAQVTGIESILPPSCLLADALGFGVVSFSGMPDYAEILQNFSEVARASFPEEPQNLVAEIKGQISLLESA